jgi:hypothetical protein
MPDLTCYAALIDVVVDEQGAPIMNSARVVRATTPDYAAAVKRQIETSRFKAAMKDGAPVRQVFRYGKSVQVGRTQVGAPQSRTAVRRQGC